MTSFVAGCKSPVDGLTNISLNFNERVTIAATLENGKGLGREKGSHRLSFQIVNQPSSPNTYRVTGLTITSYDQAGGVAGTLVLEPRTATLETNDAVTYDFHL
jgi:hypothetical protein